MSCAMGARGRQPPQRCLQVVHPEGPQGCRVAGEQVTRKWNEVQCEMSRWMHRRRARPSRPSLPRDTGLPLKGAACDAVWSEVSKFKKRVCSVTPFLGEDFPSEEKVWKTMPHTREEDEASVGSEEPLLCSLPRRGSPGEARWQLVQTLHSKKNQIRLYRTFWFTRSILHTSEKAGSFSGLN